MEVIFEQVSETHPSEFLHLNGIEYFKFEEEFMENNMRCVPMIIRFKMDKVGIKLKLSEWKKFSTDERIELALMSCNNDEEIRRYSDFLERLIQKYTGRYPTTFEIDKTPSWNDLQTLPENLSRKLSELDQNLSIETWRNLSDLQRFALLKLCRKGHANKNFPNAMKEFNLDN